MKTLTSGCTAPILLAAMLMALATSAGTMAYAANATCVRPASDAAALSLAASDQTGNRQSTAYWWRKADLTIGIAAAPTIAPMHREAVEQAIATWQATLRDCLNHAVTLSYLPVAPGVRPQSDIVVHLVAHAGGSRFGGMSVCGPSGCTNALVAYVGPPGRFPGDPEAPSWHTEGIALHEIGHALGLGHANNLWEGFDLMAYGWASPSANYGRVPEISQCDVDALAYVWSWAMEGGAPVKPEASTFTCMQTP